MNTQQTTKRQYLPSTGVRVRLQLYSDYTAIGLPSWDVLLCCKVHEHVVTCARAHTANGEHDGKLVEVPLASIDPPVGWRERYTIHCTLDRVQEVLGWMKRGIVVRFSQYIGDGSTAFQPMDNSGVPHWRFTETTDTIPPEQTNELIRVVKLETVDASLPCDCQWCNWYGYPYQ